jgi:hypothetical protein
MPFYLISNFSTFGAKTEKAYFPIKISFSFLHLDAVESAKRRRLPIHPPNGCFFLLPNVECAKSLDLSNEKISLFIFDNLVKLLIKNRFVETNLFFSVFKKTWVALTKFLTIFSSGVP